jgi:hypothetical protein
MKVDQRLSLIAHGRLGIPAVLPSGDHHEDKRHCIEDPYDGKLEARDFIVETEAIGAPQPATEEHQPDAVDFGDRDVASATTQGVTSFKSRRMFIAMSKSEGAPFAGGRSISEGLHEGNRLVTLE